MAEVDGSARCFGGGCGPRVRNGQPPEAGRVKETDCMLQPPEGKIPAHALVLVPFELLISRTGRE